MFALVKNDHLNFLFFLCVLSPVCQQYQAGAKHVYAVEASEMAEYARKLIAGNPLLSQKITVGHQFLHKKPSCVALDYCLNR